ncbi:conserved hypothetical protein [Histoplasma capsulatum H143]|uniref:Uncharacterized protein n=1 Tax=Ajellomyces capsulatus (strain H143) TaxID=544712 RepID=C6HCS9_AJECH|nr:conserved hypothetical protein [Histoplasma capsulatum H143]
MAARALRILASYELFLSPGHVRDESPKPTLAMDIVSFVPPRLYAPPRLVNGPKINLASTVGLGSKPNNHDFGTQGTREQFPKAFGRWRETQSENAPRHDFAR